MLQPLPPASYKLAWSDEFSGPDGASPDSSKWTYDAGGNGWVTTSSSTTPIARRTPNQGGNLVVTAQKETYTGSDGVTRNYTSARLKTQGLFSQAYGRFEARIRIPAGRECGPPSGCSATISLQMAGRSAAKSTSWKILARSRAPFTDRCMARAPSAERATPPRPSACPPPEFRR